MSNDRQTCADQILKAIDYGKLPADETEARLRQMIRDELSGADQSDSGRLRVELCNSLLWQLYTHGEVRGLGADDDAMKARIEKGYTRRRRRKRLMTRAMISLTAAMVLLVGLTAAGTIQPLRWFTGRSTEDEQQYIVEGHEIKAPEISTAFAEHDHSGGVIATAITAHHGEGELSTDRVEELKDFLGFDPAFPESFPNGECAANYYASIDEACIVVYCDYRRPEADPDAYSMTLWMKFYTDPNELIFSYEQDETGQEIIVQGKTVYRYANAGRTNYLWTQDNTLYRLHFQDAVQNEEDYVRTVITMSENRQPTEQTVPRNLQATDDPDALIAFLGFDPGLPHTVAGVYTSCSFTGLIRERYTAMSCYYRKGSQPIDDPLVTIIIRYYHDANDAYISLEQSEEGETISVGGIDVYRYRNCDIYGYMWTQENQVCTFSTTEPPEIAEAFLKDFLRQRNAPPVQAPRSDIRSLQTTTDPYELITFLGFDPGLPQTVAGVYSVSYYRATIIEENLTIISLGYMKEGQEEGNTEFKLYAYYYPDANDAYLSFEQSEEGELISLCGTQIYRYRNVDRNSYTWTRDAQVWSLTTKEPQEAAEAFLEDFLRQRSAATEPGAVSSMRSLQATNDLNELIAFLGFDPRLPVSLNGAYIPARYNAHIDSEMIRVAAQYEPVDHTITDPPFLSVRLTCFNQQDGTRVEFQQDAEGEYVLIGGVSVYRHTNTWTYNYLWIEDRTIVKVLTDLPFEEADPLVEEIIKSRSGM